MSEQIKDGGPAFPLAFEDGAGKDVYVQYGMKLRDYFAGAAMQAIWGAFQYSLDETKTPECVQEIARDAYAQADAMIAAREAKS